MCCRSKLCFNFLKNFDLYCQEIVGLVVFFKRDNWFCHKYVGDGVSLKLLLWIKRHLRGALIYTFQIKME